MPRFELTTVITAPVERVFDLSLDIDVHTGSMAGSLERAVGGVTSGLIGLDQQVTWAARHFGIQWRMTSVISAYDRPARFVDQMVKGPFEKWWHEHRFTADGDGGTVMVDVIDYRSPFGLLGRLVDRLFLGRYMRRLIVKRNDFIKERAEAEQDPAAPETEPGS